MRSAASASLSLGWMTGTPTVFHELFLAFRNSAEPEEMVRGPSLDSSSSPGAGLLQPRESSSAIMRPVVSLADFRLRFLEEGGASAVRYLDAR